MRIVDAHIHFLPPEVKTNLSALTAREPYWGLLLDPPVGKSIQAYATPERMIADMDAAGVEKVVIVGEYFQNHDLCVERNNQAIELVRRYPDRVLAMATIQPLEGAGALDEVKRALDGGLHGVGELNPYAQGFRLDDPRWLTIAEYCAEVGVPINLHVNEEVGRYYPGKSATPLRHYVDLAERVPECKLIFAHWGGGLIFYEMMPSVRRILKNVWYDTAASPLQFPTREVFSVALTCVNPKKLLFGSDYPLRLYPKVQKEAGMALFLEEIAGLEIDDSIRTDLMGGNALRLFGLEPEQQPDKAGAKVSMKHNAIKPYTPIQVIAENPAAAEILSRYGLDREDDPNPRWEPLAQALAVRGYSASIQQAVLEAIQDVFNTQ